MILFAAMSVLRNLCFSYEHLYHFSGTYEGVDGGNAVFSLNSESLKLKRANLIDHFKQKQFEIRFSHTESLQLGKTYIGETLVKRSKHSVDYILVELADKNGNIVKSPSPYLVSSRLAYVINVSFYFSCILLVFTLYRNKRAFE